MVTSVDLTTLVNQVVAPGVCEPAPPAWLVEEGAVGPAPVCLFAGGDAVALRVARPDVLVLADEEGGTVSRLEPWGRSSWPSAAALGAIDDLDVTRRVGAGVAAMARDAGIDVVLAPVADVSSELDNPVIGVRSFGSEADLVARHAVAFIDGVQAQGLAACVKHFPGHGATTIDSHIGLPVVDADLDVLRTRDLAPFAAAIDAGVRCVLTAHVSVPSVDDAPATMSARWLAMLRDEFGFDGVVISDALDMHAISSGVGRAAGAVGALRAGIDLLCVGNPGFPTVYDGGLALAEVHAAIAGAVDRGELPLARLEEAARRVADLSAWVATQRAIEPPPADAPSYGLEVVGGAVRATGEVRLAAPPVVVVVDHLDLAGAMRRSAVAAAIVAREPDTEVVTTDELARIDAARPIVVVTGAAGTTPTLAAARAATAETVVVVYTGTSDGAATIAAPLITTMGDTVPAAAIVADLLFGEP